MKKVFFFLISFCLIFFGCDEVCTNHYACNYEESEDFKYAYEQEEVLTGLWNLVDIYDNYENYLFPFSSDWDCELDKIFQWINISFNADKTCQVTTSPSDFPNPIPIGSWSINICENILNFTNNNEGYHLYLYPDYLPFGNQAIIQLWGDVFMCGDLASNSLHWKRM